MYLFEAFIRSISLNINAANLLRFYLFQRQIKTCQLNLIEPVNAEHVT